MAARRKMWHRRDLQENPDIYEHYGDALFMCGEKEKAMEYWHKAVQLNSTSKTLDRKIHEQKYIE